jgi:hypothetical protein
MKRIWCTVSMIALMASTARAATLSATPADLSARVGAARPGDIVQLAPGAYGAVKLQNIVKAPQGVTIQGAPAAVFTSLDASGSSFLTFDGIEVAGGGNLAMVWFGAGAHDLALRNSKVHQADNQTLLGSGVVFNNAANVTIDHNEFSFLGSGVGVQSSTGAVIANNLFHDIGSDGIDLTNAVQTKVVGNRATNFHPQPAAHPDFIQFWGPSTSGLDIEDNRFDRGTGGVTQGIFGEDGAGITIKNNILRGTMFNGIGLSRTKGAEIEGNFLDGYPDMPTRIIVRGGCTGIAITNNTAQTIINYVPAGQPACKDVRIAQNTAVAPAPFGDDRPLEAWLRRREQRSAPGRQD